LLRNIVRRTARRSLERYLAGSTAH